MNGPLRPLTVVQLVPALQGGGAERSTLEIGAALVRGGHRSIVVSAGGRLVAALVAAGSEHVAMDLARKTPLAFRHVITLRRLLKRWRPDVVHARSRLPAWVGELALRELVERETAAALQGKQAAELLVSLALEAMPEAIAPIRAAHAAATEAERGASSSSASSPK